MVVRFGNFLADFRQSAVEVGAGYFAVGVGVGGVGVGVGGGVFCCQGQTKRP